MDFYGHLFEGSDKQSADRMQKLFGERPPLETSQSDNVVVLPSKRKQG